MVSRQSDHAVQQASELFRGEETCVMFTVAVLFGTPLGAIGVYAVPLAGIVGFDTCPERSGICVLLFASPLVLTVADRGSVRTGAVGPREFP